MAHVWTMAELLAAYDMKPHEEGGYYRELWANGAASQIYYLLAAGETGAWHRIQSGEVWLWHHGAAAEIRLGGVGGEPVWTASHLLGCGDDFSFRIPPNTWQQTENKGEDFAFFSCITIPAYRREELELVRRAL